MLYALWNPVPWLLFLLGVGICVFSVRTFHRKYPNYPFGSKQIDAQADNLTTHIHESGISSYVITQVSENMEGDLISHSSAGYGR